MKFYKLSKIGNFLKKFSGHILAVRRANYSIKRAQDIGLQLMIESNKDTTSRTSQ